MTTFVVPTTPKGDDLRCYTTGAPIAADASDPNTTAPTTGRVTVTPTGPARTLNAYVVTFGGSGAATLELWAYSVIAGLWWRVANVVITVPQSNSGLVSDIPRGAPLFLRMVTNTGSSTAMGVVLV